MNEPKIAETPASPHPSLPPTTTMQEDITTASQRKVNLIWEYTQAFIAIFVVVSCVSAAVWAAMGGKEVSAFLAFICGNVVGFYFSRTNHAAIGGVGPKPDPKYEGR
jgi:hypothetical protein